MIGILIRRHVDTYREDGQVTIEAEIEVLQLQVKYHPRLPTNHQKLGRVREGFPT